MPAHVYRYTAPLVKLNLVRERNYDVKKLYHAVLLHVVDLHLSNSVLTEHNSNLKGSDRQCMVLELSMQYCGHIF